MLPADFHLETRYHYTTLTETEQELYLFLLDCFTNYQFQFYFTCLEFLAEEAREKGDAPCFYYDIEKEVDLTKTLKALLWDCPELYYVSNSQLVYEDGKFFFGKDGKPEYTREEIAELDAKLEAVLARFDGIEDDFELELAVHDYVIKAYDYEDNYNELSGRDEDEIFTIVSLLKTGRGVCGALSSMIQFVLQRRGVPVIYLVAEVGQEGDRELHAWLAVKIKGEYYHVDVTNNEGCSQAEGYPLYEKFNLTDEELGEEYADFHIEYPELQCTATEYNYYRHFGLHISDIAQVEEILNRMVAESKGSGRYASVCMRVEKHIKQREVAITFLKTTGKFTTGESNYILYEDIYDYYTINLYFLSK